MARPVRAEVAQLISQLRAIADHSTSVLRALGEVGTPEILARLAGAEEVMGKSVKEGNAELAHIQKQICKAIRDGLAAEIDNKIEDTAQRLEELLASSRPESARRHRSLMVLVVMTLIMAAGALLLSIPAIRALIGS